MWLQLHRVNRHTDWHWPINSLKLIHHEAAQFQLYITPETHHNLHYFERTSYLFETTWNVKSRFQDVQWYWAVQIFHTSLITALTQSLPMLSCQFDLNNVTSMACTVNLDFFCYHESRSQCLFCSSSLPCIAHDQTDQTNVLNSHLSPNVATNISCSHVFLITSLLTLSCDTFSSVLRQVWWKVHSEILYSALFMYIYTVTF